MVGCGFPGCELPSTDNARQCSANNCDGQLHHMCFSGWCFENKVEDPPGNASYCWSCVQQTYKTQTAECKSDTPDSKHAESNKTEEKEESESDEHEEDNKEATESPTMNSHVVSDSVEMSWMTDGCRVLLSFGLPPTWHGGMLKFCPSQAAPSDGQCSEMYVAFDDGELRKFHRGECAVYDSYTHELPLLCARTSGASSEDED